MIGDKADDVKALQVAGVNRCWFLPVTAQQKGT